MKISKEKIMPYLKNKYYVISFLFIVWVSFFDQNNLLFHRELKEQKKELEEKTKFYKNEIQNNKSTLKNLNDTIFLEKYAREKYRMKKPDEDLFVVIEK